jgi:hypothetical protein
MARLQRDGTSRLLHHGNGIFVAEASTDVRFVFPPDGSRAESVTPRMGGKRWEGRGDSSRMSPCAFRSYRGRESAETGAVQARNAGTPRRVAKFRSSTPPPVAGLTGVPRGPAAALRSPPA